MAASKEKDDKKPKKKKPHADAAPVPPDAMQLMAQTVQRLGATFRQEIERERAKQRT